MLKRINTATRVLVGVAMLFAAALAPSGALAQSDRQTGLRISGDRPVEIEGDKFEVLDNNAKAVFTGNVRVSQGNTVVRTSRLTIHYLPGGDAGLMTATSSRIERLEAEGGVNIRSNNQVATGDSGVFHMDTEVLVITGERVTLTEDGNVATGCKLTVAMKTGRAKLEGCSSGARPTILLQPRKSTGN